MKCGAIVRQPRISRFGAFELDERSGELRKNGVRVNLERQPFQVLLGLLSRPGELVTRDEVRQQLWPADTFVDFDHSLNAAIKRLRDSLGESASAPVYIETLPPRGYRFSAPVQQRRNQVLNNGIKEPSSLGGCLFFRCCLIAVLLFVDVGRH